MLKLSQNYVSRLLQWLVFLFNLTAIGQFLQETVFLPIVFKKEALEKHQKTLSQKFVKFCRIPNRKLWPQFWTSFNVN